MDTLKRFWVAGPLVTLLLVGAGLRLVHGRAGDEQVLCETGTCTVGSGGSWLLTGLILSFGILALLGAAWTRRVHRRGKLGPFKKAFFPDGGEIVEGLWIIAAIAASWWLLTRGPEVTAIDAGRPNSWAARLRDQPLSGFAWVPSRFAWFLTGLAFASPFGFAFGTAAGREWYILRRRRQGPLPVAATTPTRAVETKAVETIDLDLAGDEDDDHDELAEFEDDEPADEPDSDDDDSSDDESDDDDED